MISPDRFSRNQKQGSKGIAMIFMAIAITGMVLVLLGPSQKKMETNAIPVAPADTIQTTGLTQQSYSNYVLRTIIVTACIIVIIFVIANIYRRQKRSNLPNTFDLKVLGKRYISAKHYLLLLKFKGRLLLVGVTDSSFTLLSDVGEEDSLIEDNIPAADSFSDLMQKYSLRKKPASEKKDIFLDE